MTERVDFYVLQSAAPQQRWTFACRLTEKAYLRDLSVLILSDSPAESLALDDLLWTFNERSFIPHQICADEHPADPAAKVYLAALGRAPPPADILVNLAARLPEHWERYPRIAEVIDADEERRRLGRERFKSYRDGNVPLETHQLADSARE
jgi:DNA polymerase III subunit chi